MKKKVLMSLVLLAIIGTSAVFAQRVGETVQVSGQTYRVESNTGGRLVLQLVPSLNGNWRIQSSNNQNNVFISFNGGTAVFSELGTNINPPVWQDGKNKGYIKVGDQYCRNLRSTGNLTWSGQVLQVTYNTSNPNVATGTQWVDSTITASTDGSTITFSGGSTATWIKAGIQ